LAVWHQGRHDTPSFGAPAGEGAVLIVMLGGGDKSTQAADIARAIALAGTLED
jgi:hypothetical protein